MIGIPKVPTTAASTIASPRPRAANKYAHHGNAVTTHTSVMATKMDFRLNCIAASYLPRATTVKADPTGSRTGGKFVGH